jgi:hypothetical protein
MDVFQVAKDHKAERDSTCRRRSLSQKHPTLPQKRPILSVARGPYCAEWTTGHPGRWLGSMPASIWTRFDTTPD